MVDGFWRFVEAGEELAKLHIGYETVEPWLLDGLPDKSADPRTLRVKKMRFANKADRSSIIVNNCITLSGIPEEAYRYQVNGRSGIENYPNTWSDYPRYIVDLLARIVGVSVESVGIIDDLPSLGI